MGLGFFNLDLWRTQMYSKTNVQNDTSVHAYDWIAAPVSESKAYRKLKLCSTSRKKLKIEIYGNMSELNAEISLRTPLNLNDFSGKSTWWIYWRNTVVSRSPLDVCIRWHNALVLSKSSLLTKLKTPGESTGTDAQMAPQEKDLPLTSHCVAFVNGMRSHWETCIHKDLWWSWQSLHVENDV